MARADHTNRQILDFIQTAENVRLERAENTIVIVAHLLQVFLPVVHVGVHQSGFAEMRPQKIAGKQQAARFIPCKHGIRPVQKGRHNELQRPVAQLQNLSRFYHMEPELLIRNGCNVLLCRHCGVDFNIGIQRQQPCHTTGMIRFRMVHDQVIDF